MSPIILEAHDLTKKYRHTVALDHIDLQIEKGKIYGFIGQNGAGKTTFLRLVTGLAFPTSGTLGLWGKSSAKDLQEQRKRIGCMIVNQLIRRVDVYRGYQINISFNFDLTPYIEGE